MKIKGVFSYLGMYVYSFFPKNTGVRLLGYLRLFLFLPQVPVYDFAMYGYFFWQKLQVYDYFFPNFPPCTIKKVCKVIVFFLIFHYVQLSKCYVRLFFYQGFHYVRLFGYVRLLFFPEQSTMYGYSSMYGYCFFS